MGDSLGSMRHPRAASEKGREAFRLSNDLLHDLVSGASAHTVFETVFDRNPVQVPVDVRTAATRMCLFHVIITLAKWTEFQKRYRDVIPAEVAGRAKDLSKEIAARGIVAFRNKVVGHIWDNDSQRALTSGEIQERLNAFVPGGARPFLKWAGDPLAGDDVKRPPSVIEAVRDAIKTAYGLTDADLDP